MSLTDPVRPSGYFAYGYHATTAERAGKIQRDQRIEPTAEDTHGHWLGYGAYFWQDAPTWAWQWLNRTYNRRRLRPAQNGRAVFVARIDLDHCLDFLDTRWNYIIRRAHRMLRELHAASGEPMPTQSWNPQSPKWNDLDCAVIDLAVKRLAIDIQYQFRSVRAPFIEGEPFYEGSALYTYGHVAICVIDPTVVSDLTILRLYRPVR
jgi:hypothetical protein